MYPCQTWTLAVNKFSQALDAAEACLALCPEFTKAAYRRGQALLSLERFDDAAECFGQLLVQDPGNGEARKQLHQAAKMSAAQHKDGGTQPPEIVAKTMSELKDATAVRKAG
jgi:tetratricopeptide (TPR) repeat protein